MVHATSSHGSSSRNTARLFRLLECTSIAKGPDRSKQRQGTMSRVICYLVILVVGTTAVSSAQLATANDFGVTMGHLHYQVRDVEANKRFWVALGGEAVRIGEVQGVRFPDVLILLSQGDSVGGTEGSVVNHVAFRVQSLDMIEAAGFELDRMGDYSGVASVFSPGGERIELFDESATNLTFTADASANQSMSNRHNVGIDVPIIAHHIHLYLPDGVAREAQRWYATMFGGIPGMRWRYIATDLPGMNFNFSSGSKVMAPTRGRMLDHIGFEVANLEKFYRGLVKKGVVFDSPYQRDLSGIATAVLTDPWGTSIELTEGYRGL